MAATGSAVPATTGCPSLTATTVTFASRGHCGDPSKRGHTGACHRYPAIYERGRLLFAGFPAISAGMTSGSEEAADVSDHLLGLLVHDPVVGTGDLAHREVIAAVGEGGARDG